MKRLFIVLLALTATTSAFAGYDCTVSRDGKVLQKISSEGLAFPTDGFMLEIIDGVVLDYVQANTGLTGVVPSLTLLTIDKGKFTRSSHVEGSMEDSQRKLSLMDESLNLSVQCQNL